MDRLKDRVALITGGASGMGEASRRLFISEGARVLLADIDADRGQAVAAEFSDTCVFAQCDHTKPSENDAAVALAVEQFGKLDILFNNAGIAAFDRPKLRALLGCLPLRVDNIDHDRAVVHWPHRLIAEVALAGTVADHLLSVHHGPAAPRQRWAGAAAGSF